MRLCFPEGAGTLTRYEVMVRNAIEINAGGRLMKRYGGTIGRRFKGKVGVQDAGTGDQHHASAATRRGWPNDLRRRSGCLG